MQPSSRGGAGWIRIVAVLLTLLGCFPASAADDVDKVNGLLRRAEANLQSVASSLSGRTTPPRGSAGKLLANRLQQALDDLTPAKSLLETIPSSAPGRDEAAARYSAAAEEYNRLRAIMTGSDAPPPPSDEGVKLNYQQEELLKNARFHLREVEGNAEHLTAQTERLRVVEDQLAIDHREVIALRSVIDNARRKTGFARDTLGQLPADGQGVADISQRVVNADAKVSVAADYLNPLHAALQDLINPANYPQFEPDRKRLRDLAIMFGDTMLLQTNRPLAAETLAQAEASKAECLRIAEAYFRLIQQQTDQGKAIEGIGNGFLRNHAEFLAAAEAMRSTLPDEIRSDLATARQQGADAVAQQKPLWFTGGIPQVLGYAEDRLVLLAAIDPDAALQLDRELAQTRTDLKTQADSLRELIIRENRMPGDGFQGPDRDEAIEIARSAWNVQQQEYEVLAVRIPAEQWRRETKWTFSNGTWYFSDKSRLQVRLFVADHENPELAIDRVITVWKDHQAGDSMYGIPLRSFDETLEPSAYLLRDNVMP